MLNLVLNLIQSTQRPTISGIKPQTRSVDGWYPLRQWLNGLAINNAGFAHLICRLIPVRCPFERRIRVLGRTLIHIPPLCKLNPLYEELVHLRFRAICYLADECGEDVRHYC